MKCRTYRTCTYRHIIQNPNTNQMENMQITENFKEFINVCFSGVFVAYTTLYSILMNVSDIASNY